MNLDIVNWLQNHALPIILIIFGAWLVKSHGLKPLEGVIRRSIQRKHFKSEIDYKQRQDTLVDISRSIFGMLVWIVAIAAIVTELGINLAPLLTGAGLIGLALSFSARDLIMDFANGIFIISENQYRVGDVVQLGQVKGQVTDISLRATTLRDLDGTVHHVPNGSFQVASNVSKDFSSVNLNMPIKYSADLETAITTINNVGKAIKKDKKWEGKIRKTPKFLRVESFGASTIKLKIYGETVPLAQWEISGELRRRLIDAFHKEKIEPYYKDESSKE